MPQHGDGEAGIDALMLARQTGQGQHERTVGIAIVKLSRLSRTIPTLYLRNKWRANTRCNLCHARHHSFWIIHGDKRHAGFGDARLFKANPL